MKNYLKTLWFHKVTMIIVLFVSFLSCFVFVDFYNKNTAYYEAEIIIENIEQFDATKLTDETFLNEIKASGLNIETNQNKYDGIDVEKMLKNDGFSYTINENKLTITTGYQYYETFFLSSNNSVSNRAKTFIRDSINKINQNGNCVITFLDSKNIVSLKGYQNRWLASSLTVAIVFFVEIIVCGNLNAAYTVTQSNCIKICFVG